MINIKRNIETVLFEELRVEDCFIKEGLGDCIYIKTSEMKGLQGDRKNAIIFTDQFKIPWVCEVDPKCKVILVHSIEIDITTKSARL